MWSRLKLFILVTTPTAILYALWYFSQKKTKGKSQNQLEPDLPKIRVTDVDSEPQSDSTNVCVESEIQASNDVSELQNESTGENLEEQIGVGSASFRSKAEVCVEGSKSEDLGASSALHMDEISAEFLSESETTAMLHTDEASAEFLSETEITAALHINESSAEVLSETEETDAELKFLTSSDAGTELTNAELNLLVDKKCENSGTDVTNTDFEIDSINVITPDPICSLRKEGSSVTFTEAGENVLSTETGNHELLKQEFEDCCALDDEFIKKSPSHDTFDCPSHMTGITLGSVELSEYQNSGESNGLQAAYSHLCNNEHDDDCSEHRFMSREDESGLDQSVIENGLELLLSDYVKKVGNGCDVSTSSSPIDADEWKADIETAADESVHDAPDMMASIPVTDAQTLENEKQSAANANEKNQIIQKQFDFPSELCGRLIGKQGRNIQSIREKSGADVIVRSKISSADMRVVVLEGMESQVSAAFRLIKTKFPESRYPGVNYEEAAPEALASAPQGIMQLSLPTGVNLDVIVSRVVSANHVFIQQPTHPSFPHLERQMQMMMQCYEADGQTPGLPQPFEVGIVCVARIDGYWYRVQVVSVSTETNDCHVKLVDYGGYVQVDGKTLKQIRRDFTALPFQAIECYLYGVISPTDEEFPPEASSLLVELVSGAILQAQVVAFEEDQVPYVLLSKPVGNQSIVINRELVDRGVARWMEF